MLVRLDLSEAQQAVQAAHAAIEAARQLKSKEVCTEHLLLALMKEEGSVAYNALRELNIKLEDVRKDVAKHSPKKSKDSEE